VNFIEEKNWVDCSKKALSILLGFRLYDFKVLRGQEI